MGADFLKTKTGSKKDFVITYQKTTDEIEVLYFGEQYHENNARKIKKYFYKDFGFSLKFGATSNPTPGNYIDQNGNPYNVPKFKKNFSFEPLDDFFRNYTYYDLDFYGLGRRGAVWKGNRMIRADNN